MRIPFLNRIEKRAEDYTEAIIAQLIDTADTSVTPSGSTAAEEVAIGLWGRAFASAKVSPSGPIADALTPTGPIADALTPTVLQMVGRNLAEYGESVWEIEVEGGELHLEHASDYTIQGMREWMYDLSISYPDGIVTRTLPAARVLHVRYAEDGDQPWKGIGPFQQASTTRRLNANLETRLAEESSAKSGYLIPVPDVTAALQGDLNKLKGKSVLVKSTADGWDDTTQAPKGDFESRRIGFNPPQTIKPLRDDVGRALLASAGVPSALLGNAGSSDTREGYRQFLHGTIQPIAKLILGELRYKLDRPDLSLDFDDLMASDIAGRARAFGVMVSTGGMELERAAALSGLLAAE